MYHQGSFHSTRATRSPDRQVSSRLLGVVRTSSGDPIPGAEVTLLPQDVTTLTGADGAFAFLLPAGRVTLHVSAPEHVAVVVERIDLVPGGSWRRDVVLVPSPPARAGWSRSRERWNAPRASLR